MAALEGAVTGGDHDHVAVGVGQALGLDVPGLVEVALDEALAPAGRGDGLADGRVVQLGDLVEGAGDLQALAAALMATGRPCSSANATTSSAPETGSGAPATSGAPARWAI